MKLLFIGIPRPAAATVVYDLWFLKHIQVCTNWFRYSYTLIPSYRIFQNVMILRIVHVAAPQFFRDSNLFLDIILIEPQINTGIATTPTKHYFNLVETSQDTVNAALSNPHPLINLSLLPFIIIIIILKILLDEGFEPRNLVTTPRSLD
ncbi:hypothetical protein SLOPH_1164 [Spraguea lophii 42_110]|uniref:Uncharacterized protein n=1 Tax=Spraguea lophii (strain 42_110) TaxID=1358809 RepID=S7XR35_SPRLO|nr:hypothetical protein SLOPH_1164 [Spraguea lophii 42_110]